jgi:hypothetical protein
MIIIILMIPNKTTVSGNQTGKKVREAVDNNPCNSWCNNSNTIITLVINNRC